MSKVIGTMFQKIIVPKKIIEPNDLKRIPLGSKTFYVDEKPCTFEWTYHISSNGLWLPFYRSKLFYVDEKNKKTIEELELTERVNLLKYTKHYI